MFIIKVPNKLKEIIVDLPPSKSISNRLLMLNALSLSPKTINNLADCDDTIVMKNVLTSCGNDFNIGAAGTAMRFLTAYFSIKNGEWHLTGDQRMQQRPIKSLVETINKIGGQIEYSENKGFPPLHIFGKELKGGNVEIDGNISSQYISALLMIAPLMTNGIKINLKGKIISTPYIKMTLSLMKQFGIDAKWKDDTIVVPSGEYIPVSTTVESDWSAVSYWFEIVALSKEVPHIYLKGLENISIQGDSVVRTLFNQFGVESEFTEKGLLLYKGGNITNYFQYDFTYNPDLVPTIAVTCAFLDIPFFLTGLQSLLIKETNRILALSNELRKFGFDIQTNNKNNLFWNGGKIEKQPNICLNSYNDHRMIMSFAPALVKTEPYKVENPTVVTKSYPNFWEDLKQIGITNTISPAT